MPIDVAMSTYINIAMAVGMEIMIPKDVFKIKMEIIRVVLLLFVEAVHLISDTIIDGVMIGGVEVIMHYG